MLFIISLILAFLVVGLFADQIKKHATACYVLSVIIAVGIFAYSQLGLKEYVPEMVNRYGANLFSKSTFSTALFTVVMYTAVFNKREAFTKNLYRIRGEISIIACILTLAHNVIFGMTNFKILFTDPLSFETPKLIAAIVSVILIILMLPLMITSFKCVRKKMNYKTWKQIQRLAYVFYGLIYVHIMCLFVPKASKKVLDIGVYSLVFILYFVLRIRKYYKEKGYSGDVAASKGAF